MSDVVVSRSRQPIDKPTLARQLMFGMVATGLLEAAVAWVLLNGTQWLWPGPSSFSPLFIVSTGWLIVGSCVLSLAVRAVRRERQAEFRAHLVRAIVAGGLFIATQSAALGLLIHAQPEETSAGESGPFVIAFAVLHAMHFTLAQLFLWFVMIHAAHDRYDHEYHWGVTLCTWFWHGLGIVWCVVLTAMAIIGFSARH